MFWFKKEKMVPCKGCGCYVHNKMVKKVDVTIQRLYGKDVEGWYGFCKKCTVPYDRVVETLSGRNMCYKEFQVDEKTGEPIGYTKEVPKTENKLTVQAKSSAIFTEYDRMLHVTKPCSKCKKTKTLGEFYNDKKGKYKKCSWCKVCMDKSNKRWIESNRLKKLQATLQVEKTV